MTVVGVHASHEQVHPSALLEAVQLAEQVGFTGGMSCDHFSPWSERQAHSGGRGPLVLQVHLSYAADDATALEIAHDQWRTNVFAPPVCWDLDHVALFDEAARHVPPEAVQGPVLVSSDPARHAAWLHELVELGFDEVYLHHVGKEQREFLEVFGEQVLPQLDVSTRSAA